MRTVINLCEEHEYWDGERAAVEAAFRHARIAEHRLPVPDGATIPPDVLDRAVAAAAQDTTYVHCRGGRERSAAVAVALLATRRGVSIDEALRERRGALADLPPAAVAARRRARVGGLAKRVTRA